MDAEEANRKRMRDGANFLGTVWEDVARRIVELAIQVYKLSPEVADAVRTAFLRRTPYLIEPK
jgi:hypothetical protein